MVRTSRDEGSVATGGGPSRAYSAATQRDGNQTRGADNNEQPAHHRDCIIDIDEVAPLVPVGDAPGVAAAIVQALESPPDRAVLRERASRYGTGTAAREFIEVLDKLG